MTIVPSIHAIRDGKRPWGDRVSDRSASMVHSADHAPHVSEKQTFEVDQERTLAIRRIDLSTRGASGHRHRDRCRDVLRLCAAVSLILAASRAPWVLFVACSGHRLRGQATTGRAPEIPLTSSLTRLMALHRRST